MNKTNLLLSAFILSAVFLLGCSSECEKCEECNVSKLSSGGVENPSSSSNGGTVVSDRDLVRKNITLNSDKSYASIDGEPVAYTENDATNHLDKIDFVAYCNPNMGCKNNSIYSPWEIKLFVDHSEYLGKSIFLYEVPAEKSEIFKTATRLYGILDTYNALIRTFNNTNDLDEIPIEVGKVFFVLVPENGLGVVIGIVIIKQAGDKSVDLEIIERPIS